MGVCVLLEEQRASNSIEQTWPNVFNEMDNAESPAAETDEYVKEKCELQELPADFRCVCDAILCEYFSLPLFLSLSHPFTHTHIPARRRPRRRWSM